MIVKMLANQLVDGEIEFISLVPRGANRQPFKIVKNADSGSKLGIWAGLCPELEAIEKRFAESATTEKKTVTTKKTDEPAAQAAEIRKLGVAKLRHRLAGLYEQQQNLWERPNTPAFSKFDDELTFDIEKSESELRVLRSDDEQMTSSSAFFRRGGTSSRSNATLSDSAYDQRSADVCKAESEIDLSPISTQADFNRVSKADADGDIDLETFAI